jgi:CHAT domain-containing protein
MSETPRPLAAGQSVKDRLQPGAFHAYELQVGKDEFVHVIVEQLGLDVRLMLFDPDGRLLAEVDSPTGTEGAEEVTEAASSGGSYRLEVHPVGGEAGAGAGTYRLRIAEQRPATLADRLGVAAERAFGTGESWRRRGQAKAALASYRLASELWRDANNPKGVALAAYRMGWMEDELGRSEAAAAQYRRALDQLGEGADPALRAVILNRWGRNHFAWGLEQSRAAHVRAYMLFRALKATAGQAAALHNLGNVYTALGANQRAREHYEMAANLWRQVGDAGEEAKTLRNLVGLVGRPGGPQGSEEILTRAQALGPDAGGKSAAAGARADVSDRQGEVVALAALGAALAKDGKLQEAADCYAKIFAPSLDAGSLVLWYELGDDRSVLWTVAADGRGSYHPLARRADIEAAAQRLFDLASQDDGGSDGPRLRAAKELSEMLLAPAARQLGAGRLLLLVVEGALDRVPFALLPEPAAVDGKEAGATVPLLARHEIVYLSPAILPLAAGRRRPRRRGVLMGPAVVGDPVLRRDDPRLGSAPANAAAAPPPESPPALRLGLRGLGLGDLPALPFSRREAEAVAALVPASGRSTAFGFDANPDSLSTLARRYRVLHVASLALLSPAGSGLVLTLYDRQGGASTGFLPLADLARLDLPLELMVLSGSRVAWDAAEGGLGLAQAAMRAGTARVVTTLWSAQDESATEIMRRFYQAFLGERLAPTAALRQAQLAVAADPRWHSPAHWAGFVFAGTWCLEASAEATGVAEGTIETSDTGGTGGGGKPPSDYPTPDQLASGEPGGMS